MSANPLPVLSTRDPRFETDFARLERRRGRARAAVDEAVAEVVEDVRQRGDRAVIEATQRFDGYVLTPERMVLSRAEIEKGAARLDPEARSALEQAASRIRSFHEQRVPSSWQLEREGERLGQRVRPLDRVAIYVPSFKAPLASTVLMLGIPAVVAGVPEVVMATSTEHPHPAILAAAELAGIERIYRIGGAQAIAALAFGTESVRRVDKIVGPGSVWVQAAKRQVLGEVAIDAEAGPSEVLIVADDSADPRLLASDLLAQAEHEESASVVLACPEQDLIRAVLDELEAELPKLPRRAICEQSLRDHSAAILTRSVEEAIELANRYAAEHLQLVVREPRAWLDRVRHAGAVFLGPHTPVPLGDYVAGPSHVLPTGGTARFFSVCGVEDFVRRMSVLEFSRPALERVAGVAVRMAELEGLGAHARAVRVRLERPS
jgi:histidinol dehydrogenase